MTARDDFTKPTIDALAKRVGYICSNPACKKHTSGPNNNEAKYTLIGVAAHIAAAAPGGPRYDTDMLPEERRHISNGVWLCSNCATLIDKDERSYPSELLKIWKYQAELDMKNAISSQSTTQASQLSSPILETDLIWRNSMRSNKGHNHNYKDLWDVKFRFSLVIHNNSSFPAYNVQIKPDENFRFFTFNSLPRINNLPAFANFDLEAHITMDFEGDYMEADALMSSRIPKPLNGLRLSITYKDEARREHEILFIIRDGETVNEQSR